MGIFINAKRTKQEITKLKLAQIEQLLLLESQIYGFNEKFLKQHRILYETYTPYEVKCMLSEAIEIRMALSDLDEAYPNNLPDAFIEK